MTEWVVDLFGGPGGWAEACRALGLLEVGIEWDEAACKTRKAAGHAVIRADVAQYPTEPFKGRCAGLIASPPCQAWSMAGKRKGELDRANCHRLVDRMAAGDDSTDWTSWEDERSPLVAQPVRWVRDLRPAWVALEQVPAVLGLWQHIGRVFDAWGYRTFAAVLNSADYGVPQTRERAILGASMVRDVAPPEPTHCKGGHPGGLFGGELLPWVSMACALGWGATERPVPTVTAGGTASGGPEPIARGGREALTREREREEVGSIAYRLHRGAGMTERHGERPDTSIENPAPVITSKARTATWVVDRRTNSKAPRGGMKPTAPVPITEPAPTLTSKAGGQWVVREENLPDWTFDRPATTVVGSFSPDVIAAPGYRLTESRQQAEASVKVTAAEASVKVTAAEASVKVTAAEASVLQSFRDDYPWQGSRSKVFEQIGNAIPPLLALHVLSAVTGLLPADGSVAA